MFHFWEEAKQETNLQLYNGSCMRHQHQMTCTKILMNNQMEIKMSLAVYTIWPMVITLFYRWIMVRIICVHHIVIKNMRKTLQQQTFTAVLFLEIGLHSAKRKAMPNILTSVRILVSMRSRNILNIKSDDHHYHIKLYKVNSYLHYDHNVP